MAEIEHVKLQLIRLVEAEHMLGRLIDLTKERLETAGTGLTKEDVGELSSWLTYRLHTTKGRTRIKWRFVCGVFDELRDSGNFG